MTSSSSTPAVAVEEKKINECVEAIKSYRKLEQDMKKERDDRNSRGLSSYTSYEVERFNTPAILTAQIDQAIAKIQASGLDAKEDVCRKLEDAKYAAQIMVHNFATGHPLETKNFTDKVDEISAPLKVAVQAIEAKEAKEAKERETKKDESKESKGSTAEPETAEAKEAKKANDSLKSALKLIEDLKTKTITAEVDKIRDNAKAAHKKLSDVLVREARLAYIQANKGMPWKPIDGIVPPVEEDKGDAAVVMSTSAPDETKKDKILKNFLDSDATLYQYNPGKGGADKAFSVSYDAKNNRVSPVYRSDVSSLVSWKMALEFLMLKTDVMANGLDLDININRSLESDGEKKAALKVIQALYEHGKTMGIKKFNFGNNVRQLALSLKDQDKELKDAILKMTDDSYRAQAHYNYERENVKSGILARKTVAQHLSGLVKTPISGDVVKEAARIENNTKILTEALREFQTQAKEAKETTPQARSAKFAELSSTLKDVHTQLLRDARACSDLAVSIPNTPGDIVLAASAAKAKVIKWEESLNAQSREFIRSGVGPGALADYHIAQLNTTMSLPEMKDSSMKAREDVLIDQFDQRKTQILNASLELKEMWEKKDQAGSGFDANKAKELFSKIEEARHNLHAQYEDLRGRTVPASTEFPQSQIEVRKNELADLMNNMQYMVHQNIKPAADGLGMTLVAPGPSTSTPRTPR